MISAIAFFVTAFPMTALAQFNCAAINNDCCWVAKLWSSYGRPANTDPRDFCKSIPGLNMNGDKVIEIDWRSQGLTGGIPPMVGNLANLQTLKMSNNQLTGGLPLAMGNMRSLKRLRLSGNNLDGDMSIINQMPVLNTVDLSLNPRLSGMLNKPFLFVDVSDTNILVKGEAATASVPFFPPSIRGLSADALLQRRSTGSLSKRAYYPQTFTANGRTVTLGCTIASNGNPFQDCFLSALYMKQSGASVLSYVTQMVGRMNGLWQNSARTCAPWGSRNPGACQAATDTLSANIQYTFSDDGVQVSYGVPSNFGQFVQQIFAILT